MIEEKDVLLPSSSLLKQDQIKMLMQVVDVEEKVEVEKCYVDFVDDVVEP
jgi:hypothetical protein